MVVWKLLRRPSVSARSSFFDNAKFILIVLVVVGHVIQPFTASSEFYKSLYGFIFLFHMPAFILVAGYFAKSRYSAEGFLKNVLQILVPYLIFQCLYLFANHLLFHDPFHLQFLRPYWVLWFFLSLFFWRLMVPAWSRLPSSFVLAVMVGIAAGYFKFIGDFLSLSRTLVFFPFFLMGYFLHTLNVQIPTAKKIRILSILFLAAVFAACLLFHDYNVQWLYGDNPYSYLGVEGWRGGATRLSLYGISFALVFAFLTLVPTSPTIFTKMGTRSIYPFLLHGFLIRLAHALGIFAHVQKPWERGALLFIAVALTIFLSTKLVEQATRFLVNPFGFLLRKKPLPTTGETP